MGRALTIWVRPEQATRLWGWSALKRLNSMFVRVEISCRPDEEERTRLLEMYKPALLKKRAVFYSSNKGKIMNLKKTLMNKQTLDFNDSELFSREDSVDKFNIIVEEEEQSRRMTDSHRDNETTSKPIKAQHGLNLEISSHQHQDSIGDFSVNSKEVSTPWVRNSFILPLLETKS